VARRIDIELTSRLDDGRYTWRASGAREPRGTLDGAIVPDGAKVGEVLRAEVDSGLDGVDVLSIVPRKQPSPLDPRGEALTVLGTGSEDGGVQVTLATRGRGRRDVGDDRDERRGPRRDRDRERGARPPSSRGDRARTDRPRTPRSEGTRPPRDETRATPDGDARTPERRGGPRRDASRGDGARRDAPRRDAPRRDAGRRDPRRSPELTTTTAHRNALLATLRPEQLPVAEQLLRGGLPAVRQAIDEQNRAALAQGRPTVQPETILAIADDLLPLTSLAAWKDRAAAVQAAGPGVRLRDLRPVVTSARTVTLDEEGRGVLKELQTQLHTKLDELRTSWVGKVQSLLDRGEVVEALHVVARPPDASTRCPAELAAALTEAAGKALDADLTPHAWITVLDAVVASPMRRSVHPAGIPAAEEAQAAAVRAAGHVPALAKLLGMRIPPPPPPASAKKPAVSSRRSS
jgi:hypothetical protein